ncbi:MAG: glutamate--tRNA ligase [Bacteroidales bacterium]|nr:glutamate--tRNA ligase [Bacteroidales bacterium]
MNNYIRVRFAPSPTGPLHIGGVRTALYNYLFARKNNGTFILRIEDTDRKRYVEGAEEYIKESLQWCGIEVDEGVEQGGEYEPYRQSQRKHIYDEHIRYLLEEGKAYYAFDTPEELEAMRNKLEQQKADNTSYNAKVRHEMTNSFSLSEEEVRKKLESGEPYVIRFTMPENAEVRVKDIIRGEITVNTSTLDDKVLYKSDGMPTYHLANIVDDHTMKISHVIRGEEWLPSLPLHALLYKAFEWDLPHFAHLPLLLKPSGKGKLSKRDGDKLGFPVFPLEWKDPQTGEVSMGYREEGYFPEAFVNILVLLGWNPGTEQEFFTMDELIQLFTLDRVSKGGARFDQQKAHNINSHYLQQRDNSELAKLFHVKLKEKGFDSDLDYIKKVVTLVKERVSFVHELWDQAYFFFRPPYEYDPKTVKKRWKENTPALMKELKEVLEQIEPFTSDKTEEVVKNWIAGKDLGMGAVMNAFRLCIVGTSKGPHLFDIIELIGKEETLNRIQKGIETIKR